MVLPRLIAFYLPQFHPIPENDEWWGKGFTEWTNTAKARPLFRGHYQPRVPSELGFYDLRLPEVRIAQAQMAEEYGIQAFCYYHYWFAGKTLLERPFAEVLQRGEPDFPFCLCWANQTWTGIWHGASERVLIEQTYPGDDDHRKHFEMLLAAFSDKRYLTVNGKPLFLVYWPAEMPKVEKTTDLWRSLAEQGGLRGLYLVGVSWHGWIPEDHGFDGSLTIHMPRLRSWVSKRHPLKWAKWKYETLTRKPTVFLYKEVLGQLLGNGNRRETEFPCVIPNWDNTPRSGTNGLVLHGSTPELFRLHLRRAMEIIRPNPPEEKIVFIKSWNEWAEGNHLEPDLRFGRAYLQVIADEIMNETHTV